MSAPFVGLTVAGKYQIKRLLGEGGMGAVYEGVHLEIGKRIAIKTISVHRDQSGEIGARFKREARAASAIESENIVQVFDVGADPQIGLYMVMEHLSGEDLATRLRRQPPLEAMTALALFGQALHGLEKAHAAGIVHRDLKPANLFLVDRGARMPLVKILDFGISKVLKNQPGVSGNTGGSLVTRAGAVMGTALYMAPEQAQGTGVVDQRADVWAMGAVLYEVFAGRTPFEPAATYEAMIVKIVTTRPTPLLEVAPDVPPALAAVIHQALKHELDQRIPDCATFLRLLDGAVPGAVSDWLGRASAVAPPPNLGVTATVDPSVPRPATPIRASFGSHPSLQSGTPGAALTTGAGSSMVTSERRSAPHASAPPTASSQGGRRVMPLLIAGAGAVLVAAAATTVLLRSHVEPTPASGAAPVQTVATPPALTPLAIPSGPTPSASVAPLPSASAPAEPAAATKPTRRPPSSKAAPPAVPSATPAPSATAAPPRQFGGVDMSDSL